MKNAASFRRVKITPVDVMKPMLVLLLLNIIVLTVWTVVDPLQRETVVVSQDEFLRDSETYGKSPDQLSTKYELWVGWIMF